MEQNTGIMVNAGKRNQPRPPNPGCMSAMGRRLVVLLALAGMACASPKEAVMTRQPAVAGQFYPADPATLTAMVDSMLASADAPLPAGKVVAIQVPHAGYPYSGPTAAHAFRLLKGMDSVTVVMVGPSHRVPVDKAAEFVAEKGGRK